MLRNALLTLTVIAFSAAACLLVPSGDRMIASSETLLGQKNFSADIASSVLRVNDNVNAEIFHLPRIYTLPMDLSPAPKPNPANFTEDGYEDQSITVRCWRERIGIKNQSAVDVNFAEITVSHPSQLRTAFAGGKYGYSKRVYTSKMAQLNHAVIAINADYYNYRADGLIIRQGTLYREKPFGIDTLFIDSDGNFKVMKDYDAMQSQYYKNQTVLQSIVFGPVLVENGKAIDNPDYHSAVHLASAPHRHRSARQAALPFVYGGRTQKRFARRDDPGACQDHGRQKLHHCLQP